MGFYLNKISSKMNAHSANTLSKVCANLIKSFSGLPSSNYRLLSGVKSIQPNVNSLNTCFDRQIRCIHKSTTLQRRSHQIPSTYDRYVFPEPPEMLSEEEHDVVLKKSERVYHQPRSWSTICCYYIWWSSVQ